ncbi:Nucleotidyltransferase domain-containing protein [Desulfurobacterium pacificum]|uniref:Nucleotidyltransferase domain-containing protein n=1 Tax=Desulfurobacterium pacificum TaxID=240166 RepID=A0ABY1NY78_9BACT|nr:nucleotidyltransferase domain-containing protein [Desulfurobacterium pacificum]SMP20001.1 Nucleotidyltransferase domain-containing protein [Desulfurobacterium pacificum]
MPEIIERSKVIEILRKFTKKLLSTNILPVKEIYLFGSYAYGNPDEWSDIDVAILIDQNYDFEKLIEIEARIRQLARNFDSRIEPLIFTDDSLGLIENEVKKGIRIYPEV